MKDRFEREIDEWEARAEKAVTTERDDLARTALKAKAELEQAMQSAQSESENLDTRITQLEFDMATLKNKLAEAKTKLKDITLRRTPDGKGPVGKPEQSLSAGERKVRRAMGRFERLQSQVERLEARVRSYEVGGPAVNAWEDADMPADPSVEAELEQLKKRLAPETEDAEA